MAVSFCGLGSKISKRYRQEGKKNGESIEKKRERDKGRECVKRVRVWVSSMERIV